MDPKIEIPEIKGDVNKVDDEDEKKKGAGVLGGLFGGGSAEGLGGLGGIGGIGRLGAGALGGGGMLATKAGMLALVLMGSAVAAGIGLAGYKMFGPNDSDKVGGNLSLFAPKPQRESSLVAPVKADGSSQSLDYLAQGRAGDRAEEAAAAEKAAADAAAAAAAEKAAADAAAASAAADEAKAAEAAKAAAGGAINAGGGAGAVGSMASALGGGKKLGALSGATGGGATTASASLGKFGDLSGASRGASSAFSKSGPGAKTSSAARSIAGRGSNGFGDARRVLSDQAGGKAASTFAAGKTYDGAATNSAGAIAPDGSAIAAPSAGPTTSAQPTSVPANSSTQSSETPAATTTSGTHVVTPWETSLQTAMVLTALCGLLLVGARLLLKDLTAAKAYTVTIAKILCGLAIVAAAAALYYAGQATFGPGGQKTQGGLIMAAATLAGGLAAYTMSQIWSPDVTTDATCKTLSATVADSSMLMMVIGGGAAVALIAAYMVPKTTYTESEALSKGYPTSYNAPAPTQNYNV